MVENLPANAGDIRDAGLIPGLGRPLEGGMAPTPVFLPGESHGQRSLTGYSSQGHKESDITEVTQHAHIMTCIHCCTIIQNIGLAKKIHLGFLGQSNTLILASLITQKILYIHPSLTPHHWQSLLFLLSPQCAFSKCHSQNHTVCSLSDWHLSLRNMHLSSFLAFSWFDIFLLLHNIHCWHVPQLANPVIYRRTSWLLPSFGNYE